jgi:uncharacterized protein (DUF1800 family)
VIARLLTAIALVAIAGGCGPAAGPGAVASSAEAASRSATATPATLDGLDDAALLHLLDRLTYGPRPGDLSRLRAMGVERWLDQQLDPGRIGDGRVEGVLQTFPTLSLSVQELHRQYPRPDPALRAKMATGEMTRAEIIERYPPEKRPIRITAELQAAKVLRATTSERQLQEVVVDFWFNHFNVFSGKGEVRWYVTAYERDAIRANALGRFPDLVRATAHHPAMLFYLDNWLSVRPGFTPRTGRNAGRPAGLNENYARELLELHTLGVEGGYTQADVTEVARAFTGWTIERPREDAHFLFRPFVHDDGEKVVLGQRLPAGGGMADGERVIDLVTRYPATARFIATKLVRRFVNDDPPPALVHRVATTYRDTGGDVAAMLRTIVRSEEFWEPRNRRVKIKTPLEFVASSVRALDASVEGRGAEELARACAEIGQPLYGAAPPTGYADRAEAWVNAGALLARMSFALSLAQQRVPGTRLDVNRLAPVRDAGEPKAVLDQLLASILRAQATPETRATLVAQLSHPDIRRQTLDDRGPANTDVAKLVALVIGSPEFQRR